MRTKLAGIKFILEIQLTTGYIEMEEIPSFFKFSISSVKAAKELNFLSEPSDILKALLNSKEEGTSIGIKANDFGTDPIITAVEDIIFEDGQTLIILKHYDLSGYILPSYKINLLNVTAVYPFASPFKNPILHNLEKEPPILNQQKDQTSI